MTKHRYDQIADALLAADWPNVSIGNKSMILAAVAALREAAKREVRS